MDPAPMSAKETIPVMETMARVLEKVGWKARLEAPAGKSSVTIGRMAKRTSYTCGRCERACGVCVGAWPQACRGRTKYGDVKGW